MRSNEIIGGGRASLNKRIVYGAARLEKSRDKKLWAISLLERPLLHHRRRRCRLASLFFLSFNLLWREVPFECAFVVSEDKKLFPIMRKEFLSLFKDLELHHRQPTLVISPEPVARPTVRIINYSSSLICLSNSLDESEKFHRDSCCNKLAESSIFVCSSYSRSYSFFNRHARAYNTNWITKTVADNKNSKSWQDFDVGTEALQASLLQLQ